MWVDSQCHVSPLWYEPVEVLLQQMKRNEVAQAILIQMLGQTDNSYQQSCLRDYPGMFASVVLVDSSDVDALSQLRQLSQEGATGVRLRPTARSPGSDPLAIWRCAAELGLAVSCVGNTATFCSAEFADLIAALPTLTIVLEHLGGTSAPDADEAARNLRLRSMELSRFRNVYMKIPGLGELQTRRPGFAAGAVFEPGVPPVLERAIAAFGAQRLMWGSDYPPVAAREGYANALAMCRDALNFLPSADLQDVFGGVARRVFRLPSFTTRGPK